MHTIREELKKIYHFLLLLILLFAVNLVFNMLYDWGGVSVIVRIYIMVLSCYIVYNFSQIDSSELKQDYITKYGKRGSVYLFCVLRIFPFLFIYLLTVIFTLINFIQYPEWPIEPVLRLLDGRYANTVIYAVILFIVLRLKIRPGIAIPFFIISAICYFYTDKLLYNLFEPGFGISLVKLFKFSAFYFVLIFGFVNSRYRVIFSGIISVALGTVTFVCVVLLYYTIFSLSGPGSRVNSMSARILMKSGYYQVFDKYQQSVRDYNIVKDIEEVIQFAEKSGKDIYYTPEQWENFIIQSNMKNAEYIFRYLNSKKIKVDFANLSEFAILQSEKNPNNLFRGIFFKKYFASYYNERHEDFFSLYKKGDTEIKIWIIDVLANVNDYNSIRFLIDRLTDVDKKISERSYSSLKQITKLNPAESGRKEFHDLSVVNTFRVYAEKIRKE